MIAETTKSKNNAKVLKLAQRLAGDKWEQVNLVADNFLAEGYNLGAAYAKALDVYKCSNTP